MHEYEISILNILKKRKASTPEELEDSLSIGRDTITWALENLSSQGFVKISRDSTKTAKLSDEGKKYLKQFPEEELVASFYKSGGKGSASSVKNEIGLIWAKRNGWIFIQDGKLSLTEKGTAIAKGNETYNYRELLNKLSSNSNANNIIRENESMVKELGKRNLVDILEKSKVNSVELTDKGMNADVSESGEGIGALTRDVIVNRKWKNGKFRSYDINANYEEIYPARLHPMHEFIDTIRTAWFNMGFTEVSGPIIESAFWNFDALFSPQDHPTREMQDTFFLKNPSKIGIEDLALLSRVRRMHTKNWKETWRESVAQQALLRTHTTSVSARYINKFANNINTSYPAKLFSVGKVFRNESIDYKHLAELYQIDGIVIGNNLTFSNLISTLKSFYSQLGMDNIIVKPSYFPFVEPGLEIYYYDEEKQDAIELCGGGIIRKEITKAMGTNKTVLAWGGGLERLMFKVLGIETLTELYKNDLGWLRNRKELKL